ncbi:phytanoyl-CoA dioxygenase family protein [Roseibium marinum]|uniref:Phytanoyl-CoA dioxygenase PhyH n=1 Tax=Roseibium marinum TaxID=281252 RepID=A0A2S3UJM9_9HYPH|nr:phytanoyl-CoA dioxygenase family protein [Roseibium marinum]POF27790.1 phytanoyl-CoA dioxygenase PhyH [Roseibium marinum]
MSYGTTNSDFLGTTAPEGDWDEDGYLILRNAIPPDQLQRWTEATDTLHRTFLEGAIPNLSQDKETATTFPPHWEWIDRTWDRRTIAFRRWRIVEDDPVFLEMLDHPAWFPIVLKLFGNFVQISLTHVIVYPPKAHDEPYIHVDGGDSLGNIRTDPSSLPLYVKVMIFLNDLSRENEGNFSVVPGSHRVPYEKEEAKRILQEGRAKQLKFRAGDCILFPHSLWHGPAPNRSKRSRKTLFVGYSPTFMRPYDYQSIDVKTLAVATPRQRRLLGDLGGWDWRAGCHYYSGPDQEEIMSRET